MPARSWGRGIREVTGAVPSDRGNPAFVLPRWVRDPVAADFACPERLAFEATAGGGLTGWLKPFSRFQYALDLFYGADQWPGDLAKPPRWPGHWMPGKVYDPSAYEPLQDGPPEVLRRAVEAHQAEEDERLRQTVRANMPCHAEETLREMGVPPARD